MKIWQILLLIVAVILAIISGINVFFSSRPEFHYVVYLTAFFIIMLSVFYNNIFPSKKAMMDKRRDENRKRQEKL